MGLPLLRLLPPPPPPLPPLSRFPDAAASVVARAADGNARRFRFPGPACASSSTFTAVVQTPSSPFCDDGPCRHDERSLVRTAGVPIASTWARVDEAAGAEPGPASALLPLDRSSLPPLLLASVRWEEDRAWYFPRPLAARPREVTP